METAATDAVKRLQEALKKKGRGKPIPILPICQTPFFLDMTDITVFAGLMSFIPMLVMVTMLVYWLSKQGVCPFPPPYPHPHPNPNRDPNRDPNPEPTVTVALSPPWP